MMESLFWVVFGVGCLGCVLGTINIALFTWVAIDDRLERRRKADQVPRRPDTRPPLQCDELMQGYTATCEECGCDNFLWPMPVPDAVYNACVSDDYVVRPDRGHVAAAPHWFTCGSCGQLYEYARGIGTQAVEGRVI